MGRSSWLSALTELCHICHGHGYQALLIHAGSKRNYFFFLLSTTFNAGAEVRSCPPLRPFASFCTVIPSSGWIYDREDVVKKGSMK